MTREELNTHIADVRDAGEINSFFMRCKTSCGFSQVRGDSGSLNAELDKIEMLKGEMGDNLPIEVIAFFSDDHINIYVEKDNYDYVNDYSWESHQHINIPYIWNGNFLVLK